MTDEELTGILLRVLGALPNSDDMKIARAIDREATARCIEIVLCSQGKTLQEIAVCLRSETAAGGDKP